MKTAQLSPQKNDMALGVSLPNLIGQQVNVQPEATAVICGDQQITFQELERASRQLATHLHQIGVATDDCVGLYVDPSLDLMVGAWGILYAGGAYLPLSPEYPEDRLRYMIDDSSTRVVVTQDHLVSRLTDLVPKGTHIVTLADTKDLPIEFLPAPQPNRLAYVIYTSGSTGRPKGVMIEHRSIVSQMRWLQAYGHLGTDCTVLQKTPMSFDAAQWELLAPAVGARVVMGSPGIYRDPPALISAIRNHDVTTLQCVPTLLQALLEVEDFRGCTSLQRVYSGGEPLSRQLTRDFVDALPWASLINLYGPTECTINSTACLVDPKSIDGPGTVSIGVPVDNTQCFILDQEMAPVDIGEIGELYIGGIQLARGYLHQPEQTRERFIPSPFVPKQRLYRTGDLAYWNLDGTIQFSGRVDNQVKLRGYRVELEEIALAIEEHTWVRRAAALVNDDPRTGSAALIACVELNPREAVLMDQGVHGVHHQSKADKLQVKAQLSNPGLREPETLAGRPVVVLPGKQETARQRRETFARKSYRYYDGGKVTRADLQALLAPQPVSRFSRDLAEITFAEFGQILRWFGQFHSDERLLPKYSYASPGALYATQMYLETDGGLDGVAAGIYYYHPVDHTLVRIDDYYAATGVRLSVHFVGKRQAIEPVYKKNILEVLEFEAGHMVGIFEDALPEYGLTIRPLFYRPSIRSRLHVADEDHYLGSFEILPNDGTPPTDPTEIYVQAHPGRVNDIPVGQYRYADGELERISDALILPKHVIAINQQVYERASIGITAVSRASQEWLQYISLGTKLHHLQRNDVGLGFMPSGYSSKTGHPLPAARRMDDILADCNIPSGPSYFCIGGKVSEEQLGSEGMHEDAVHVKGPAEMIKDDLTRSLPHYMIPNRVLVFNELPLTANGKVDGKALAALVQTSEMATPYVAPVTQAEKWLARAWGEALRQSNVSIEDDFFTLGGNSLTAVALVNKINHEFGTQLPLQVVFECPKLADLAARIDSGSRAPSSRLIQFHNDGPGRPVFCWPGLGGYPMNLRLLAQQARVDRPFYGVQAHGINPGEQPYATIGEMAAADVAEIRHVQPEGPYTLVGYSFGARVAFEAAWHLEQLGEKVENLVLVCPGNPRLQLPEEDQRRREASYTNPAYVTILYSVFAGSINGPGLDECLDAARDEDSFVAILHQLFPALDEHLIRRVVRIVGQTYEFEYSFRELAERCLNTPVTIIKASGDDYSFIEGSGSYSATPPTVTQLAGDHYSVLKEHGVAELAQAIRAHLAF
ncbi:MAG TPA: amino acid adenylation domain-containing protein [Micromonospora sp.]|nr:amino acid adenylation domain-containing protein [Micromonospora sp.]